MGSYLYKSFEEFKNTGNFWFKKIYILNMLANLNTRDVWSNNRSQCSIDEALHSSLIWWELMNTHVWRCPGAIDAEIDAVRFQLRAIVSSRCVPFDRFNWNNIKSANWTTWMDDRVHGTDRPKIFSINRDLIGIKWKYDWSPCNSFDGGCQLSVVKIDPVDIIARAILFTFTHIYIDTKHKEKRKMPSTVLTLRI